MGILSCVKLIIQQCSNLAKLVGRNYEHIVKAHQNTPQHGQNQVSDELKFQVFQQMMDTLFQSFNSTISVATFADLSACVFNWLEEHCKPQVSLGPPGGAVDYGWLAAPSEIINANVKYCHDVLILGSPWSENVTLDVTIRYRRILFYSYFSHFHR